MESKLRPRSNETWIRALSGGSAADAAAVLDLEAYLHRVLRRLAPGRLDDGDVEDLVQESLARIVGSLESFRGESAFPTWATGIATRVVYTELRRRAVRGARSQEFSAIEDEGRELSAPNTLPPDELASKAQLEAALRHAIATRLTDRQRTAILAELRGLPTVEIAEQMRTTQNALYKLTHDARKKLRQALLERGFLLEAPQRSAEDATP